MIVLLFEFFDFAIDDFVRDSNVREHPTCLSAQFNSVGEDEDPLARFEDVLLREFRKYHCLSSACGQLKQQVVPFRKLVHSAQQGGDGILLISVKGLPFMGFELLFELGIGQRQGLLAFLVGPMKSIRDNCEKAKVPLPFLH